MTVCVLFFGATASVVGTRKIEISLSDDTSSKIAFDWIKSQFPKLGSHKLLYSLNQNYAKGDEIVRDGDEIAIFTAVSGG